MDWKIIIAEIQRHGQMTQSQIAAAVDCGQATISDLANGSTKQPSYSLGAALLSVLDRARKPELIGQAPQKAEASNVKAFNAS